MTLTIKNSPELNGSGKPASHSQNSESKSGQSPRSNPVCLEVGVTIRSLPTEADSLTKPIREEGKTVIVFDNGAVLRSANSLPVGRTVVLSNPKGRDVVCRVVGGRNLPSVKGYIEVEFIEPVSDFWGIHQDSDSLPVAAPPATPIATREVSSPPPSAPSVSPRAAATPLAPAKPTSGPLGSGPKLEDISAPVGMPPSPAMRQSKAEPAKAGPDKIAPEKITKATPDYNRSETVDPTSVANWRPPAPESATERRAIPGAPSEATPITSPASGQAHDFMSKGLMAYEQPNSSQSVSKGRTPLIVGGAALALAVVCAGVLFMRRTAPSAPVEKAAVVSQRTGPPAATAGPNPIQAPLDESAQAATQIPAQTQAKPVVVDQTQPAAAVTAVPAMVTAPVNTDSLTESRSVRRQENTVVGKKPDLPPSRRPMIPNLKMRSPSAPNRLTNLNEGTAPATETASAEAVGIAPPAGLLTSAGRISNPPAPPPSAPAPPVPAGASGAKTVREPTLISSTRLVYPATAKQANIQGNVTVSATIDADGTVVSTRALSGPLLLRQAAADSVKQWRYSPALTDGKPTPATVTVSVEFKLH